MERACKPNSVRRPRDRRGDHLSGPTVAGRLERPTRSSRDSPEANRTTRATSPALPDRWLPTRACWRWGLPCRRRRRRRGALLPHRFTLAGARRPVGGLFSVALSLGSLRVAVSDHRALPSSDFPPAGKTRRAIARPAPSSLFYREPLRIDICATDIGRPAANRRTVSDRP